MLLIAGGLPDPNLHALAEAAAASGRPWVDLRVPAGASPPFHWDLDAALRPEGPSTPPWGDAPWPTGAFLRQDVFAAMDDPRPEVSQRALGWFATVQGWLLAHPEVRLFNRDIAAVAFHKPAALGRARAAGLRTPPTWVSNDMSRLRPRMADPVIAKPVAGGGLCQTLADALEDVTAPFSPMPALVQPQLVAPEIRLFVVGREHLAFEVRSPSLDYRALQDAQLEQVPVPPEVQALRALMADFRMDFGAADFKTEPATGKLVFLELNTSPMFARFDQASGGALCRAMVEHLAG